MTEDLRKQLEAFVCGHISLIQLYEWLTPRFGNLAIDSIECEIDSAVIMGLQHIQDGIESEDDVRGQLSSYLIQRETASSNRTVWTRWTGAGG